MLKKIMFWVLVLVAALRVSSIFTLLFRGATNLPALVVVLSSACCVTMVVFLARSASHDASRKGLELGYVMNGAVVALNLLLVCFGTPATIDLTEMFAIGTFFDLIVAGTMLVLSHRQTRYITVHNMAN